MLCAACLVFTILLTNIKCNWLDVALAMFLITKVIIAYWNAAHGASGIVIESYMCPWWWCSGLRCTFCSDLSLLIIDGSQCSGYLS